MENSNNNTFLIVGSIIVAGVLIAGAIIYTQKFLPSNTQTAGPAAEETGDKTPGQPQTIWDVIKPIDQTDHVLGNPNAELTLILYSDIECPYCKRFHETMHQVIDDYGKTGQLRWVYRHFPLEQLHPTASKEAEATECAAELGGNEKFWKYLDELSFNNIDTSDVDNELLKVAGKLGLDQNKFKECLDSGKYTQKVKGFSQEAMKLGARGTPYSVIIDPKGKIAPIPGALPYEQIKEAIETVLNG